MKCFLESFGGGYIVSKSKVIPALKFEEIIPYMEELGLVESGEIQQIDEKSRLKGIYYYCNFITDIDKVIDVLERRGYEYRFIGRKCWIIPKGLWRSRRKIGNEDEFLGTIEAFERPTEYGFKIAKRIGYEKVELIEYFKKFKEE